jgi:hypothetical protein
LELSGVLAGGDAYHPSASAKSYAAHLTWLCCGLKYDANPQEYAVDLFPLNMNPESFII